MTDKKEVRKPDFIMADGYEIFFDLTKMSYGQWLGMFDSSESDERSDETLVRVAGISVEKLKSYSFIDYKKLFDAFLKKTREPLSDPNA